MACVQTSENTSWWWIFNLGSSRSQSHLTIMANAKNTHVRLLTIPFEVRSKILEFSIGWHDFHVSRDGDQTIFSFHESNRDAPSISGHESSRTLTTRHLFGLMLTCRLLAEEAGPILYRQTIFNFSTPGLLYAFFRDRGKTLSQVNNIHLNCGPAKHTSPELKSEARQAFRLLANTALKLDHLHLTFGMYYGIYQDRQLLGTFWISTVCRIRSLSVFTLSIYPNLQGPVDFQPPSGASWVKLQAKVKFVEEVLRSYLCQPTFADTSLTRNHQTTVREIQRICANFTDDDNIS